jgi:hypothetical protein
MGIAIKTVESGLKGFAEMSECGVMSCALRRCSVAPVLNVH